MYCREMANALLKYIWEVALPPKVFVSKIFMPYTGGTPSASASVVMVVLGALVGQLLARKV